MKPSKGVEKRGKQTRKRNPIVLYAAEGDNKTESTYLQNFQKRNGIHIVQASGNRTDPVKMMNHLVILSLKMYVFLCLELVVLISKVHQAPRTLLKSCLISLLIPIS